MAEAFVLAIKRDHVRVRPRHQVPSGWPKGAAHAQEHGRGEHRGSAQRARCSDRPRSAPPRTADRKWRVGTGKGHHRGLLAYAPERLDEEVTADHTDMIYAVTPAQVESRRKAFLRKWRLNPAATAEPMAQRQEQTAIERLHEEFMRRIKTRTVLASAETAAMPFWALLASSQISMRRVDGWPLARTPVGQPIDLAASLNTLEIPEITPPQIPEHTCWYFLDEMPQSICPSVNEPDFVWRALSTARFACQRIGTTRIANNYAAIVFAVQIGPRRFVNRFNDETAF